MSERISTSNAPKPVGLYPHARRVGNLRSRRLVVIDAAIGDLIWRMLTFLAFLLDGANLFLLHLLHLLLLLKVHLLLLLFNNLIHEDGLIHPLRRVKPRRPLPIPLDLVLVTQGDRAKQEFQRCKNSKYDGR